jgi:hypothetical protein
MGYPEREVVDPLTQLNSTTSSQLYQPLTCSVSCFLANRTVRVRSNHARETSSHLTVEIWLRGMFVAIDCARTARAAPSRWSSGTVCKRKYIMEVELCRCAHGHDSFSFTRTMYCTVLEGHELESSILINNLVRYVRHDQCIRI